MACLHIKYESWKSTFRSKLCHVHIQEVCGYFIPLGPHRIYQCAHVINVGESAPYNRHVLFGVNSFHVIIGGHDGSSTALLTVYVMPSWIWAFDDTTVEKINSSSVIVEYGIVTRMIFWSLSSVLVPRGILLHDDFHRVFPTTGNISFRSAISIGIDSTRGATWLEDTDEKSRENDAIPPRPFVWAFCAYVMHDQLRR